MRIADAIDQAGLVVRYEQGTVGQDEYIDWPAPVRFTLQPAFCEWLVADCLVAIQAHQGDAVADLAAAIPGSVFGDEDLIVVLFWKHVAGVEAHSKSRYVRTEVLDRRDEFAAATLITKYGIGDAGAVAVGIAEVLSIGGYSVQFIRWYIVAHPVSSIVCEPQLTRFRMPIEADGVANAPRYDPEGTIGV